MLATELKRMPKSAAKNSCWIVLWLFRILTSRYNWQRKVEHIGAKKELDLNGLLLL